MQVSFPTNQRKQNGRNEKAGSVVHEDASSNPKDPECIAT